MSDYTFSLLYSINVCHDFCMLLKFLGGKKVFLLLFLSIFKFFSWITKSSGAHSGPDFQSKDLRLGWLAFVTHMIWGGLGKGNQSLFDQNRNRKGKLIFFLKPNRNGLYII